MCTTRNYDMDWLCTMCKTDKRLDDVRKCKKSQKSFCKKSTLSPKGENSTLREPTKDKR